MKTKKIEFKPPEHVIPEGTEEGEDFDMVSTYRVKPNGMVCLVQMGDVRMPGYDDKENGKEERPSYDKYRKGMTEMPMEGGMGGGMGGY